MKIRIGGDGVYRPAELENININMGGGVHVIGRMAFGSAKEVYVLLDADTLAKIARAASGGGEADPSGKKISN